MNVLDLDYITTVYLDTIGPRHATIVNGSFEGSAMNVDQLPAGPESIDLSNGASNVTFTGPGLTSALHDDAKCGLYSPSSALPGPPFWGIVEAVEGDGITAVTARGFASWTSSTATRSRPTRAP